MVEFTPEWIEEQLDKFHDSTNHEWLTECWNNYGRILAETSRLQARVQELEAELNYQIEEARMLAIKDGDKWRFVLPEFKDLQQSPVKWLDPVVSNFVESCYRWLIESPLPKSPKEK